MVETEYHGKARGRLHTPQSPNRMGTEREERHLKN